MAQSLGSRLIHAWNAFFNKDPTSEYKGGMGYTLRPDRVRLTRGNEKTIISSIYNRIAIDVAALDIQHVTLDEEGRYKGEYDSGLNDCLTLSANIDQTGRAFKQDMVLSMFDEGVIAVVPVDTDINPNVTDGYNILTMRTGKILEWRPKDVKIRLYNDNTGNKEEIWMPKSKVAILENPFYAIMNEPNSTMQRLVRKLALLDAIDEQSSSGKLDLIIQLPYTIKSEARRQQAEKRRKDIEVQLTGSKYGIAYTDSTEHITQLNRPLENNLLKQIEYLTSMLFSQLGMDQTVLNGTATEQTMLNYNNGIVEPVASVIVDEFLRKFLTKTARSRKQSIMLFRDPFKLVPLNNLAEIVDKLTRNEIMSSNEVRQKIGMKPSSDPKADELRNSNISQSKEQAAPVKQVTQEEVENQNEE